MTRTCVLAAAEMESSRGTFEAEAADCFVARYAVSCRHAYTAPQTNRIRRRRPPRTMAAGIHLGGEGMGSTVLGTAGGAFSARARSYSPRRASSERPR